MKMSATAAHLTEYLSTQIAHVVPDAELDAARTADLVGRALARIEESFSQIDIKYYRDAQGTATFSHRHSDQYATFLYLCSREAVADGQIELAELFYLLNKALHALDVYVEVDLPTPFLLSHPVGTVLGRASYGPGFFVHQGCTVGGNRGSYPVIGEGVTMYAGSSVIGSCHIGDRCRIGAGVTLVDVDVPAHSTVTVRGGYEIVPWSGTYRSHPMERYRVSPDTTDDR